MLPYWSFLQVCLHSQQGPSCCTIGHFSMCACIVNKGRHAALLVISLSVLAQSTRAVMLHYWSFLQVCLHSQQGLSCCTIGHLSKCACIVNKGHHAALLVISLGVLAQSTRAVMLHYWSFLYVCLHSQQGPSCCTIGHFSMCACIVNKGRHAALLVISLGVLAQSTRAVMLHYWSFLQVCLHSQQGPSCCTIGHFSMCACIVNKGRHAALLVISLGVLAQSTRAVMLHYSSFLYVCLHSQQGLSCCTIGYLSKCVCIVNKVCHAALLVISLSVLAQSTRAVMLHYWSFLQVCLHSQQGLSCCTIGHLSKCACIVNKGRHAALLVISLGVLAQSTRAVMLHYWSFLQVCLHSQQGLSCCTIGHLSKCACIVNKGCHAALLVISLGVLAQSTRAVMLHYWSSL